MKKLGKYIIPAAIWLFVTVYIVWAVHLTRSAYSGTVVERIDVKIVDSTADRRLVTGGMVRDWITRSGIEIKDRTVNEINLQGIERVVANNGFVGKVSAYTAADGVLRIEVGQRRPLFRLLTDGYDRYVTPDGFVFGTPASSAIYVPVVTGNYKPQFPAGYQGYMQDYCEQLISGEGGIQYKIRDLREQKEKLAAANVAIAKEIKTLEDEKPRISIFNGSERKEFKQQKIAQKDKEIAAKKSELRRNAAETARLNNLIAAEQESIKKTREKYEDFLKLLNFVEHLEDDGFWQSEIVQIIAERRSDGVLELKLVPRSGSFIIEFGDIANVDAKLDKLMTFYREGFRNLGWNEFSVVSVAYKGQVVCRKRTAR